MAEYNYSSIENDDDKNTNQYVIPEYNDKELIQSKQFVKNVFRKPVSRSLTYVKNLFPCIEWFPHYFGNPNWILSDFITGVTVAIVLVPQSMSYAKLAELNPQYGLYSAFIGTFFYFLFATSREICIGPVAVLSTEVGKIVTRVQDKYGDEYSANEIATTLALISGGIVLGIGLLRLGFIVELISLPAILAFTSGSAFNIVCGQLASLMGYKKKVKKESSTYLTLIQFLKHLPDTKVDAAFGLVGLFILYGWQFLFDYLIKKNRRNPRRRLLYIYILNLRTAFVIIISTCISFGVLRYYPSSKKVPYSIIGDVPSGLNHVGRFIPPPKLASRLASDLPISTIVLVLEHISISKSFARLNGYRVNPNQEFTAIGFTNMIGTFFGAYPVTGSFSRTALSAKCGVKTPFKSAFTGGCVLLAIYCFTNGFYYIPNATLSAIIIHCVTGLLTSYKITTKLYMFSPVDFVIFIVGVIITVFATIEDGIYWAICASCATLLWRMLLPNGAFLGRIKVFTVRNPTLRKIKDDNLNSEEFQNSENNDNDDSDIAVDEVFRGESSKAEDHITFTKTNLETDSINSIHDFQYKWVPLPNSHDNPTFIHTRYVNNNINVENPPEGVIVYRVSENFIYTNCSLQIDQLIYYVREYMRPFNSDRERLWCEYSWKEKDWDFKNWNPKNWSPRSWNPKSWNFKFKGFSQMFGIKDENEVINSDDDSYEDKNELNRKPKLRIIHLDFSQVVAIDGTSIQALLDLKRSIDDYCGTNWEMHFSGIINPWVIRGLLNAGFGVSKESTDNSIENQYLKEKVSPLLFWENRSFGVENPEEATEEDLDNQTVRNYNGDLEVAVNDDGRYYPLFSTNHPNFHVDIPSYTEYN